MNDLPESASADSSSAEQSWSQPPTISEYGEELTGPPITGPRRLYGSTEIDQEQSAQAAVAADQEMIRQDNQLCGLSQPELPDMSAGEIEQGYLAPVWNRVFESEVQFCPTCSGKIDGDGYCEQCGSKAPSVREHMEIQPSAWVAGVCDRGIRHRCNEDAMALVSDPAIGGRAIVVVCDGVSTSADSDKASLAAAQAACDYLLTQIADTRWLASLTEAESPARAILDRTAEIANQAVLQGADLKQPNPASCTLAIGLVAGSHILSATLGDSRVYWIPDAGQPKLLSIDDSMAQEEIETGMDRDLAESGPHAHVITRWLGRDAPDTRPRIRSMQADRSGWLLVCSDGLWNYASDPEKIGSLVVQAAAASPAGDPLELAHQLVMWATEQGGDDNITAGLARMVVQDDQQTPFCEGDTMNLDTPTTRLRPARQTITG